MKFEIIYHNQKNDSESREVVYAADLVHAIDIVIDSMHEGEYAMVSDYKNGKSAIIHSDKSMEAIIPDEFADDELHAAVDKVNAYYRFLGIAIDNGDDAASDFFSDHYLELIDRYAHMFCYTAAQFEDLCTDVRYLGWDME